MSAVRTKVAVITGAGSGIGQALALSLARRGARLALSDVDAGALAETALRAERLGTSVHASTLDVSDRSAFHAYADEVIARFGVVHQVYNNAGIGGFAGEVRSLDYEAFDRILGVNLLGVVHGTAAFLRHLIESGDGHMVNISSLNGLLAQPKMAAYCTSKFAVRGFTESLRAEMLLGRFPVRVTLVHPGGVRTNIATAALHGLARWSEEEQMEQRRRAEIYNEKLFKTSAHEAAETIVRGVEAGAARLLIGSDARLVDALVRALPATYAHLVAYWERRMFSA